MKKIIYTIAFSVVSVLAFKLQAQSVSYTYVKNDPFDIKNFSASVDPMFVDINSHNGYSFGWGLRGEYMMGKRLLLNFDSRIGFGTNNYRKSNNNTKNYFAMDGGLGLIFVNRVKTKNVPIILSQTTSGNTRTTVSIRGGVPAKCRLIVALRGGFMQYNNTLNYKGLNDTLTMFERNGVSTTLKNARKDEAGVFSSTVAANGTGAASVQVVHADEFGGISMVALYGGLQFRKIRQLVIDVDGYGYRGNIRYSDFFIDVLFAPVVKFRDFRNNGGEVYNVNYTDVSHLGWRVGWFLRKPKDQGFSTKFEIGSRPGFKAPTNSNIPVNGKNLYAMFSFGLYIPLNIKPVYTGED